LGSKTLASHQHDELFPPSCLVHFAVANEIVSKSYGIQAWNVTLVLWLELGASPEEAVTEKQSKSLFWTAFR
jgi:hypothetical protein